LLEAPTAGYEDAIVVPEITADNFELKHGLLNLVQNKQFFGHDKEDPHAHIRYFNKITSTMKFPNVLSTSVNLMLFPFSLEGAARIWLEKEPPRSIQTWDDLVSKFINKFFHPSKTTNLRNEITRFQQRFDEMFYEAWDRFNDLLRACPHHGFSELHKLDTFYNALNSNDQDSLNSVAGGNFLDKMPRDCLRIIESKSKVRNSRNKPVVAKVSASTSTPGISSEVAELKDMVKALLLDKKNQSPAPTPVKAVEESCVTCGGAHSYQTCPATSGNVYRDNIQEYVSQAAAANFNQGNTGYRAQISNQIRPPGPTFELMKGTCKSLTELDYFCEEVYKATTEKLNVQTLHLTSTFDFSNFVLNRLNVQTLTPELLAGPTFELMKGTCKSLTELEYFCEEVYKATTEKLDWINPEGRQYPHDLRQPLPLVPNSQGRRVIPFHHFINNDLEYLRGGVSSRKYSTSVTKTKAADYGHIKWIEDLVPNSMWSQTIVKYDKFALWGVSHWGKKRRQFYAFAALRESARDVYSKRRIIAVTKVEIVEWHDYKHLDWITVRRDDDVLYKFKEGDFHRLRIQDIEDMLLLLVQGKVTNLSVEERIAFNVSLRMFTRSVVIQRRVEDLQLGVESYQKKLNLTKPDTYRSNLRRQDAYTPYSDPRGFIYENKDKKNRLMRIDELHKFSDGTLDDVRTALNDRLKGIRMAYLPQTFWSQRDKANARAMIQAIDKRLKTRRIMRSLERFVGGRPYGGDLRLLQRTI
ncbi:retrovirus-related pol polyprotein from transposon TNT 1-94, partial [Tanacetum coccineum]